MSGGMSPTQHSSPGRASLPKTNCPGTEPIDPRTVMGCRRDPDNIFMHPPKQFASIHHITCTHLYSHLKPTLMHNLFHMLTPPVPRAPEPTHLSPFPSLPLSPCPLDQPPHFSKALLTHHLGSHCKSSLCQRRQNQVTSQSNLAQLDRFYTQLTDR